MTAETSGFAGASSSRQAGPEAASPTEVAETLKRQGQHLKEEGKDGIQRFATEGKQQAASLLKDVSNALDQVTSRLDEQGHDRIARYTGAAAEKLREVGDDLPERDLGELLRRAENFARERPAVFLAALFIAGFGAARFLKTTTDTSSAESSTRTRGRRSGTGGLTMQADDRTTRQVENSSTRQSANRSIGALLADLGNGMSTLVRQELRLA